MPFWTRQTWKLLSRLWVHIKRSRTTCLSQSNAYYDTEKSWIYCERNFRPSICESFDKPFASSIVWSSSSYRQSLLVTDRRGKQRVLCFRFEPTSEAVYFPKQTENDLHDTWQRWSVWKLYEKKDLLHRRKICVRLRRLETCILCERIIFFRLFLFWMRGVCHAFARGTSPLHLFTYKLKNG